MVGCIAIHDGGLLYKNRSKNLCRAELSLVVYVFVTYFSFIELSDRYIHSFCLTNNMLCVG